MITKRFAATVLAGLLLSVGAHAQEFVTSYVEADGEATIFAPPSFAEFLVVFSSYSVAEHRVNAIAAAKATQEDATATPGCLSSVMR